MVEAIDKPIVVLGGGGHARVLISCLQRLGANILGLAVPEELKGGTILGEKKLGSDDEILKYSPQEISLVNGIGMTVGSNQRKKVAQEFRKAGYEFITVVDPTAVILSEINLGEGVQILAGVVIQPGVSIGMDTIINTRASVDHDCSIENECHVCPGVTMAGNVSVGAGTMICTGSTIVPGVSIGSSCLVAASSVVVQDLPDNTYLIQRRETSVKNRKEVGSNCL